MDTPHVVPPRERQFPGRAPAQGRSAGCPTERKPSPQGARKPNGLGNDKGAFARRVLEALACLDLDPVVLNKTHLQLDPPPSPSPKPSKRLHAHATSESTGIIGSLVFGGSESSLPKSGNSSMGVACVEPASAAVASLAPVCSYLCSRVARAAGAVHARRAVSPMHAASNSRGTVWPLAYAEVHQLLHGQFVVGHG